ncbi:hypothetical protein ACFE04_022822 [Oxalis oulophora]
MTFFTSECYIRNRYHLRIVNNLVKPHQLDFRCQLDGIVVGPMLLENSGQYYEYEFKDALPMDKDKYYANCDSKARTCAYTAAYEGIYDFEGDLVYTWKLA